MIEIDNTIDQEFINSELQSALRNPFVSVITPTISSHDEFEEGCHRSNYEGIVAIRAILFTCIHRTHLGSTAYVGVADIYTSRTGGTTATCELLMYFPDGYCTTVAGERITNYKTSYDGIFVSNSLRRREQLCNDGEIIAYVDTLRTSYIDAIMTGRATE